MAGALHNPKLDIRTRGVIDSKSTKTSTAKRVHGRQPPKSKLVGATTTDQLVSDLVSKLTVNDVKGKKKEESPVDTKLLSMRAVNTASQSLTAVVQSGWKKSTSDGTSRTTLATVNSSSSSAAKHLAILRGLSPGDVDVERAAMSTLGKLVTLDMVRVWTTHCGFSFNVASLV